MRFVFLSDTHGLLDRVKVPDGDVLVHCGDATAYGGEEALQIFGQAFSELPHKYKIFVPGNHDVFFEKNPNRARKLMKGCQVLIDRSVQIQGVRIYGSPYTTLFMDWAFMESERFLEARFARISKDTQVLITHGPPQNILDTNDTGRTCGSWPLAEAVEKLPELRIHAFGHIHEAYGTLTLGKTKFINCSVVDEYYNLVNEPVVEDI
jgi:Icc-related predicted phosphoesterase